MVLTFMTMMGKVRNINQKETRRERIIGRTIISP
jgi:hypothetical protein